MGKWRYKKKSPMPTYRKRNKVGVPDLSVTVVNKKQKKNNIEIYNKKIMQIWLNLTMN